LSAGSAHHGSTGESHDATAAEQVILGRKSPFGKRVRVPWNLIDILFSHNRAVCEGFCRYHNMTRWLNGGTAVFIWVCSQVRARYAAPPPIKMATTRMKTLFFAFLNLLLEPFPDGWFEDELAY